MKQYCKKGHDTFKIGRTKTNNCKECLRESNQINRTKYYQNQKSTYPKIATWRGMIQRCTDPNAKDSYVSKSIKVYPEWIGLEKGYENWYDHVSALPNFSKKGYTLNRIDNLGDYKPGNVNWATATEQSQNRDRSFGSKLKHDPKTGKFI